jgi:protein-S-isoprenylcysteine O-methyltransferase Ste14
MEALMHIPAILMFGIAIVTGLVGILFLFFPDRIRQLEARLNARWGDRELATVHFGTHGEQAVERAMNREVVSREVVWDGWLLQHPRLVGAVLCLLAVWLVWQV